MESVQHFVESYLVERARGERTGRQNHQSVTQRYYTTEYQKYLQRSHTLSDENPERYLSSEVSGDKASVVTTQIIFGRQYSRRYHLRFADNRWQIDSCETECPACRATNRKRKCSICDGDGWKDYLRHAIDRTSNGGNGHEY
jgi:hypothetical protein